MRRTVIALGFITAGTAVWQALVPVLSPNSRIGIGDDVLIASYLVDGTRRRFSGDDSTPDVLDIGEATRWQHSEETTLSNIRYQIKGDNDTIWRINASAGIFFEDVNELELTDGVTVLERSSEAIVQTETMRLYMKQQRAQGAHNVVMTDRRSRTTGSAFELDLKSNTATLMGEVKTLYE